MAGDPLFGDRLHLRPFRAGDANHLVELDGDPAVMRYLTGGIPTGPRVIEREILPHFISSDADHPLFGFWAAEVDGRFIGWFAFRPLTKDGRTASLGYRLARRVWGRGYATEGARMLVNAGFNSHGVQRIVATTYEDNAASIRVLEKLGMHLHRRFRYGTDDLAGSETSRPHADDLWPGEDLEFVLERGDWMTGDRPMPLDGERT